MERVALRIVQLGAIAIVLVVSPREVFDLDRFLVPKELVLHATALLAGVFVLRRIRFTRVDWALLAYLLLSAVSVVFATNPWLGFRAFALSASGVMLFWIARVLREADLSGPLLNALAFAVVLAAATALLQAYGVDLTIFPRSRAPGGTLGNRNFVGHAAAFGLPLVLHVAFHARRFVLASTGVTIVMAALVLTRSRAAWLACAVLLAVYLVALLVAKALPWKRAAAIAIFALIGVGAALLIPNALRWRSENPYLESMQGVVNYEEGSGRGRLVQYTQSLHMAAANPLFGVGPGNWPVRYPEYAARRDGSINESEPGTTFNPWPSSDWVAIVCERGFVATALLAFAFVALAFRRPLNPPLLATIAAAGVAGAFDAVLLLALPSFVVWTVLGALAPPPATGNRRLVAAILLLVCLLGMFRSTTQLVAMEIYATRSDRASLERAARIDPANYRVRLRLARKGRCDHARAAHALFPNADAAKAAARRCR